MKHLFFLKIWIIFFMTTIQMAHGCEIDLCKDTPTSRHLDFAKDFLIQTLLQDPGKKTLPPLFRPVSELRYAHGYYENYFYFQIYLSDEGTINLDILTKLKILYENVLKQGKSIQVGGDILLTFYRDKKQYVDNAILTLKEYFFWMPSVQQDTDIIKAILLNALEERKIHYLPDINKDTMKGVGIEIIFSIQPEKISAERLMDIDLAHKNIKVL